MTNRHVNLYNFFTVLRGKQNLNSFASFYIVFSDGKRIRDTEPLWSCASSDTAFNFALAQYSSSLESLTAMNFSFQKPVSVNKTYSLKCRGVIKNTVYLQSSGRAKMFIFDKVSHSNATASHIIHFWFYVAMVYFSTMKLFTIVYFGKRNDLNIPGGKGTSPV